MKPYFDSFFAKELTEFVEMKRSLGYKFRSEEEMLRRFDKMILISNFKYPVLDKTLFDNWINLSKYEMPLTKYHRIVCLNQFSSYLRTIGIKAYIAPLPKYPDCQYIPYIYTHDEMNRIFAACDNMELKVWSPQTPILVLPCLIRMLYATGIRIGECIQLDEKDVDLEKKYLILKDTKNKKDRIVPFNDSLSVVCLDYLRHKHNIVKLRDDLQGWENTPFFITPSGDRLKRNVISIRFIRILRAAGIPSNGIRKGPRLHDLRHTMACHSFVKLSEEGLDLYCSWPYLSTYLGHQSLESTERYVKLTADLYPELLKDGSSIYMDILPSIIMQ